MQSNILIESESRIKRIYGLLGLKGLKGLKGYTGNNLDQYRIRIISVIKVIRDSDNKKPSRFDVTALILFFRLTFSVFKSSGKISVTRNLKLEACYLKLFYHYHTLRLNKLTCFFPVKINSAR